MRSASSDSKKKRPWMILVGPTAVGKSRIAEALALSLGTGIVVADSRQIYRGMDIGTDKPDREAQKRVPRRMIDLIPPEAPFSAGAYGKRGTEEIAKIESEEKVVLVEGGTGLYIKSLLQGLWDGPPADWKFRGALLEREKAEGEGTLHRLLSEVDLPSAQRIHRRDLPKIVRALEAHHLTGEPLSLLHERHRAASRPKADYWMVGVRREREDLYKRVEARVDRQIAAGLAEETGSLLSNGVSPDASSMRGLGYRQMIPYLKGEQTLEEATLLLKRDTRHYAKRQMTWFQADPTIAWIDLKPNESEDEAIDRIRRLKNYRIMI